MQKEERAPGASTEERAASSAASPAPTGTRAARACAAERDRLACKEASRRTFDGQAAAYDEEAYGSHARALYPLMVEEVAARNPLRALDLGCGTGALAELVLAAVPGCRLAGVDLSEAMLAQARGRLGDRAELVAGDSEHLPFPDGVFDVVYCNDSFHHYPDPERAAFEAWRVLRAGGAFLVGDCWLPGPARAVMNAFMPYGGQGDVRIYSEDELRAILGTWFDDVAWRRAGKRACIACAVKAG